MKKIFRILPLFLFALAACNPMGDIYDDLEANKQPIHGKYTYELVAADYTNASSAALKVAKTKADSALAKLAGSEKALNDFVTAAQYIPSMLSKAYPVQGKGSSAMVTYSSNEGQPEYIKQLYTTKEYKLKADDYRLVWGAKTNIGFFTPAKPAKTEMANVLTAAITDAKEGDIISANYEVAAEEPVIGAPTEVVIYKEDFSSYVDKDVLAKDIVQQQVKGTRVWQARVFSGNMYAQFSSFGGNEENEAWFVTPAVNLGTDKGATFSFKTKYRNIIAGHKAVGVMISTNYTNDVTTATWVDVTSSFTFPTVETSNPESVGVLNLDAYSGKINIAFIYYGTQAVGATPLTTTVQIDDIEVKQVKSGVATNKTTNQNGLFQFNNKVWTAYTKAIALSKADYDEMGLGTNQFISSNDKPEAKLPVWLKSKYPYAPEGNVKAVAYRIDNKNTYKAMEFPYSAGVWVTTNSIITKTEQFLHNGTTWVFDPTVTRVMVKEDYQALVDWVKANKATYMDPKYTDQEWWFGSSSKYLNITFSIDKRKLYDPEQTLASLSDEQIIAALHKRMEQGMEVVLKAAYPNAVAQVNGVDVFYKIIYKIYNLGAYEEHQMKFQSFGNGKFKFIEGPIRVK